MDPQQASQHHQGDLPGLKNLLELKSKYDAPAAADLPDLPPLDLGLPMAEIPVPVVSQMDNGMAVQTVQTDRLPYVVVIWACRSGARSDPPMQAGLAQMTIRAMMQATANREAADITGTVNAHGLQFAGDADCEAVYSTAKDFGMKARVNII